MVYIVRAWGLPVTLCVFLPGVPLPCLSIARLFAVGGSRSSVFLSARLKPTSMLGLNNLLAALIQPVLFLRQVCVARPVFSPTMR